MTTTPRPILRRVAGAALVAASLVGVLAGCSLASPAAGLDSPSMPATPTPPSVDAVRVVLWFGNESAAATLANTPAAREFAAMLPLDLDLRDPMGQAKSGPLPRPLDVGGVEPVFDPAVGQIYYSTHSSTFAVFYDDLGQSVPAPGLVRLGAVDTGMDLIAEAGNRVPVRINLDDQPAF
jgi:hypothetical protein